MKSAPRWNGQPPGALLLSPHSSVLIRGRHSFQPIDHQQTPAIHLFNIHVASLGLSFRPQRSFKTTLHTNPSRLVTCCLTFVSYVTISNFFLPVLFPLSPQSTLPAFPYSSPCLSPGLLSSRRLIFPELYMVDSLEFIAHLLWGVVLSRPNRLLDQLV